MSTGTLFFAEACQGVGAPLDSEARALLVVTLAVASLTLVPAAQAVLPEEPIRRRQSHNA